MLNSGGNIVDAHNEGEKRDIERQEKKLDIKALVAIIPPASTRKTEKRIKERRIRLKYNESVKPGQAFINESLAKSLNIVDYIEITVAGRKRFKLKAIVSSDISENEVWCNPEELRERGIADNSIATIRRG